MSSIAIGAIAGAVCCVAIRIKFRYGFDDALDVVAVHLIGGIIGSILLGLFAEKAVNPAGADGVLFGGGWGLFGEQVLAVVVVFAFSFVVSGLIGLVLNAVMPGKMRVTEEQEQLGLDLTQHSETGYALERI
jgi:Amt family ammonium transporter